MGKKNTKNKTDVLVVGAGPTGLLAANELARHGVSCRIVEKRLHRAKESRALGIHARTMEIMDMLNLSDQFMKHGYISTTIDFNGHHQKTVPINLSYIDSHFPFMLIVHQGKTEEILEKHLEKNGVEVERGKELLEFEEKENGIEAIVQNSNGKKETIHTQYLIGCDGAHSTVRHTLNFSFSGAAYKTVSFLADVKIKGDFSRESFSYFSSSRGILVCIPFQDEYVRIITIDYDKQHYDKHVDLQLDDLEETVNAIYPHTLQLKKCRWISAFSSHHRQVKNYQHGHAFLAGDAAHIHSPVGGQGMNTGLQDAFNLAWKLALTLKKKASKELLASYNNERHQVGKNIMRMTDFMTRSIALSIPIVRMIRDNIMRCVFALPVFQKRISRKLSGTNINYRFASTQKIKVLLPKNALHPGDRIPDIDLCTMDNTPEHIYTLLSAPWFTLFVYTTEQELCNNRKMFEELFEKVEKKYDTFVQAHLILNTQHTACPLAAKHVWVDKQEQFRKKCGIAANSTLLIRPDGYVGFHMSSLKWPKLDSEIGKWIDL